MRHSVLFTLLALLSPLVTAEMLIIAHPDCPVDTLSKKQVIDLYMGKVRKLPNGTQVSPLDQAEASEGRESFYRSLTGKNLAQINAYWARLIFVGRAKPPKSLGSSREVIEYISKNPTNIGYIYRSELVDGVKVIAHVE